MNRFHWICVVFFQSDFCEMSSEWWWVQWSRELKSELPLFQASINNTRIRYPGLIAALKPSSFFFTFTTSPSLIFHSFYRHIMFNEMSILIKFFFPIVSTFWYTTRNNHFFKWTGGEAIKIPTIIMKFRLKFCSFFLLDCESPSEAKAKILLH